MAIGGDVDKESVLGSALIQVARRRGRHACLQTRGQMGSLVYSAALAY